MKKTSLILLVLLLLFSFAACTNAKQVSDTAENTAVCEAVETYFRDTYQKELLAVPNQMDVLLTSVEKSDSGFVVKGTVSSVFGAVADGQAGPRSEDFEGTCLTDETTGEITVEALERTPQSASAITFPGLGIRVNPSRTLPFSIFGKEIYYYGLIIATGFVLAIVYGKLRCKDFGYSFDSVTDAILFAVPAAIICARIYYVAFSWKDYKDNLVDVFKIWEGGIAIYGGVIGAALGLLLFSKIRKKKLAPYLDLMGLGLLIGQLVGRWGNFFNREAHGAETGKNFFLRMYMYSSQNHAFGAWHPTFLYESLWNLLGFILLHFFSKKRKYDGQVFLMYVAWYGLGRVWIEGLRTDSLWIGPMRVSQLLAGLSFLAAVGIMVWIQVKKHPDGSQLLVNKARSEENQEDQPIKES